jgi:hypothetical protein
MNLSRRASQEYCSHPEGPTNRWRATARVWYDGLNAVMNAIGYAMHNSRSADAVIRVYDEAGKVIETHEHKGDFKEW